MDIFSLICCKNCIFCLKIPKKTKKRPGLAHFLKNNLNWAVVVAQLVKQYLHTPEFYSLNLVIGNFINFIATTKIKKKETYEGPVY